MGSKLQDVVADEGQRQSVIEEAGRVLDAEVASKSGIGGMAIKTAYRMVKGLAPGMVPRIINALLDDFAKALQPFQDEAEAQGQDVATHLKGQPQAVANALLAITDSRAAREDSGPMKKGYEKLRPSAAKHVEAAVPRLAELVGKYTA